jgi:hypothetical protein
MRLRSWKPQPVPLKPLYVASELAKTLGISVHVLQKLLESQGVVVYRVGPLTVIPLSEIRDKLPPVWDAIDAAYEKLGSSNGSNKVDSLE